LVLLKDRKYVIYFTLSNQKDLIIMKKILTAYLMFGVLFLLSTFSHAAFVSNPCATSDVTANGSEAFSCVGSIEGNDSKDDINSIFLAPDTIDWTVAAIKNIDPESAEDHSLDVDTGAATWEYTGGDTLSSPFVIVLKAASEYSAYLFKGIESAETGTFLISFLTGKDEKITPDLSHITIYSTDSDIPGGGIFGNPVPLPAALWLFGPALLGFMGFRRKTKS